jgi:hypothetical protein
MAAIETLNMSNEFEESARVLTAQVEALRIERSFLTTNLYLVMEKSIYMSFVVVYDWCGFNLINVLGPEFSNPENFHTLREYFTNDLISNWDRNSRLLLGDIVFERSSCSEQQGYLWDMFRNMLKNDEITLTITRYSETVLSPLISGSSSGRSQLLPFTWSTIEPNVSLVRTALETDSDPGSYYKNEVLNLSCWDGYNLTPLKSTSDYTNQFNWDIEEESSTFRLLKKGILSRMKSTESVKLALELVDVEFSESSESEYETDND